MTEEQAIKRIEWALKQSGMRGWGVDKAARAAWNEIKAIAREDSAPAKPGFYPDVAARFSRYVRW